MAKPKAEQISSAAGKAGLRLSPDDVKRLEAGEVVSIDAQKVPAAASAGCSGIKLVDLGGGCGLYFIPFPVPQISVCCQG